MSITQKKILEIEEARKIAEIKGDPCARFNRNPEIDYHPDMKQTFDRMFDILDTNHLTHELSEQDWEVLSFVPDIPLNEVSEAMYDVRSRHSTKVMKAYNKRMQRKTNKE